MAITAPEVGRCSPSQLDVDVKAVDFKLDAAAIKQLMQLLPAVDGVADMSPLFEALVIKSDEAALIDLSPKAQP